MKSFLVRNAVRFAAITPLLAAAPFALAQDETADAPKEALTFLRAGEDKSGVLSLDIASRELAPKDGKGPKVWLVGVAHVAEKSLYEAHQDFLGEFDVVLFESVMPAGAGGADNVKPEDRPQATKDVMTFLGTLIERYRTDEGEYPDNLDQLKEKIAHIDTRLVSILPGTKKDAWGNALAYSRATDGDSFTLLSLGEDNKPGGTDSAADIAITDGDKIEPIAVSSEGGIQAELADALNLEFQLTALSYAQPNFRPSDMTMNQLSAAMNDRGLDIGDLSGALDATSFPAQMMKFVLRIVKAADQMMGGGISDMCRVALIEVLGNEKITGQAMDQFGDGFGDVIIGERNQVVIDDLKQIIENEKDVKSVAIFYGAAHLPDFVERMQDQLGYELTGEEKWFTAMNVDMNKSSVGRRELETMRGLLRKTMSEQMGAMKKRK